MHEKPRKNIFLNLFWISSKLHSLKNKTCLTKNNLNSKRNGNARNECKGKRSVCYPDNNFKFDEKLSNLSKFIKKFV